MKSVHFILILFFASVASFAQEKKWTLKECIYHAIKNNITIKQSELDLQTSAIAKKDAIGNFLPNINASSSHSWNIGLNQNITTGLLENQTTQFTSANLNANVDIFKGLQNVNQLRKANLAIIASQYQLTKMQEDIALNVANAYLQILFNKENLKVQTQQKILNTKQYNRTVELVNAGNVPKGDLLDIEATMATGNQRVIVAENTLLLSKLSLAQLLQIQDFQNFDISEDDMPSMLSTILNETPEAVIAKAKENRTELKIAETNMYKRKMLTKDSIHSSVISSMRTALYEKSHETEEHSNRLYKTCMKVAKHYEFTSSQYSDLELLCMIHDVGKIGIPDNILNYPGPLDDKQWELMKTHSEVGYRIALATPSLKKIANYILSHHEHYDGTGYPKGLKGEDIPEEARILRIADSWDALTSLRSYRKHYPVDEAIKIMESSKGINFDPKLLDRFFFI
mgnify:CR=1 FL=1